MPEWNEIEGMYVCVCGHQAVDHAGLCLTACCEQGCGCKEYVRDFRVQTWPPPAGGRPNVVGTRPSMSERWHIIEGDCVEQMARMDEASVDAVVCDPPYGLGFMGKEWDTAAAMHLPPSAEALDTPLARMRTGKGPGAVAFDARAFQAWCEVWAREALRVLKPGGHLLAFGGTRTSHRLACAIEDAGFEIRDRIDGWNGQRIECSDGSLAWYYGSGFPKSRDVSKAIDAAAGAEREPIGPSARHGGGIVGNGSSYELPPEPHTLTAPATPEAERWQGWGTALKPAHEPIVVARKPLAGTVAGTVLAYGTGALNVNGCRIGTAKDVPASASSPRAAIIGYGSDAALDERSGMDPNVGRWPANVVLDPEAAEILDEQTGELHLAGNKTLSAPTRDGATSQVPNASAGPTSVYSDSGGASRFFYVAKASSAERNAGLDGFEAQTVQTGCTGDMPTDDDGKARDRFKVTTRNVHPTVKPIALMRWLVRLVTPPGGLVLDPFAGSGTTGCAAMLEGFRFVGIERDADYVPIARARIGWWADHPEGMELVERLEAEKARRAVVESGQLGLFG